MNRVAREELVVRADDGRVHQMNPLGGRACLACASPFPCVVALGGEQLELGAPQWI